MHHSWLFTCTSLSLKPYSGHIFHDANLILCLFNRDFSVRKVRAPPSERGFPEAARKKTLRRFRRKQRRLPGSVGLWPLYLDWVTLPCCRAPRATAWYGGSSASPPTRPCRGLSGRGCSCPGWCAANGEVMKIKSHTFFVHLLSEWRVMRPTKEDWWNTKVHKKRRTNLNCPCSKFLLITAAYAMLQGHWDEKKMYFFSPPIY